MWKVSILILLLIPGCKDQSSSRVNSADSEILMQSLALRHEVTIGISEVFGFPNSKSPTGFSHYAQLVITNNSTSGLRGAVIKASIFTKETRKEVWTGVYIFTFTAYKNATCKLWVAADWGFKPSTVLNEITNEGELKWEILEIVPEGSKEDFNSMVQRVSSESAFHQVRHLPDVLSGMLNEDSPPQAEISSPTSKN